MAGARQPRGWAGRVVSWGMVVAATPPRSHGGLSRLLQANFVRPGRLAPEVAGLLSRLMSVRQEADYTAEYVFTAAMASEEVGDAVRFVAAARAILVADGWMPGAG
jgi:uncharacterized protein (UPF0332 family)